MSTDIVTPLRQRMIEDMSARDRATDEPTKRRAIDAALIEFEHAWEKAGACLRLQSRGMETPLAP